MLAKQNRNISDRLIRTIESKAEELTQATMHKLQSSPLTTSYHGLPSGDLYNRVYSVYHELGCWLWEKSSDAIRSWYNGLGDKRCEEGIPLAEVLWALVMTKDRLLDHLAAYGLVDTAVELYQQQEFDRQIGHFFDRAMCYAAEGYARRAATMGKTGKTSSAMLV